MTENDDDTILVWTGFRNFSDVLTFLQVVIAICYSAKPKPKSVKNASGSSLKLISYSSIFASNF